jgi:hypothetical protein
VVLGDPEVMGCGLEMVDPAVRVKDSATHQKGNQQSGCDKN